MSFNGKVTADVSFFNGMFNAASTTAADPYVTGYSYAIWLRKPLCLKDDWDTFEKLFYQNFRSLDGISDITLEVQSIGFGFSNNETNWASTITKGNTEFSVNHVEFAGSPMRKLYENWVFGIRDPLTGLSTYAEGTTKYKDANHTGDLLYFTTKPVLLTDDASAELLADSIEFACVYKNAMPKNVPLNHMNMGEGSHDTANFSQSFKGDMFYNEAIRKFVIDRYADIKAALNKAYTMRTMSDITINAAGDLATDSIK